MSLLAWSGRMGHSQVGESLKKLLLWAKPPWAASQTFFLLSDCVISFTVTPSKPFDFASSDQVSPPSVDNWTPVPEPTTITSVLFGSTANWLAVTTKFVTVPPRLSVYLSPK